MEPSSATKIAPSFPIETNSYEKAFYMGVATGSASAFSENLATRSEVEALLKTLNN